MIEDDLDEDLEDGLSTGPSKMALVACCLTCRAWSHRSRFHLFGTLVLQSGDQLSAVASTLLASPLLCGKVKALYIDGRYSRDQGWIATVPLQLASKLHLKYLTIRGVDFSKVHPLVYQSFSLFRTHHVSNCGLFDNKWSNHELLSRIISSIQPLRVDIITTSNNSEDAGHIAPNAPISHTGRFNLHQICIENLSMSFNTIKEALSFLRSWTSIPVSLTNVNIVVDYAYQCDGSEVRAAVAVANRFMQLLHSQSHQLVVVYDLTLLNCRLRIELSGTYRSDIR